MNEHRYSPPPEWVEHERKLNQRYRWFGAIMGVLAWGVMALVLWLTMTGRM